MSDTVLSLIRQLNAQTDGWRGNNRGVYGLAKAKSADDRWNVIHVSPTGRDRVTCLYFETWQSLPSKLETLIEWEESKWK